MSTNLARNKKLELLNEIKQEVLLYKKEPIKSKSDSVEIIKNPLSKNVVEEFKLKLLEKRTKQDKHESDKIEKFVFEEQSSLHKNISIEKKSVHNREETPINSEHEKTSNNKLNEKLVKRSYPDNSLYLTKSYLNAQDSMTLNYLSDVKDYSNFLKKFFSILVLISILTALVVFASPVKQEIENIIQAQTKKLNNLTQIADNNPKNTQVFSNKQNENKIIDNFNYDKNTQLLNERLNKTQDDNIEVSKLIEDGITWFESQPKQYYTIQLASLKNKQILVSIKQQNDELKYSKIIPIKLNNEVRYVLLLGSFAKKNLAEKIVFDINQRSMDARVRSIKSLKITKDEIY